MSISLKDWVSFLDKQNYRLSGDSDYILFETCPPDDAEDFLERSMNIPRDKRVKVRLCL